MNKEIENQLITTSERLAQAAETLSATLSRLDAQNDELAAKVERIIAAIETDTGEDADARKALEDRIAELERANTDLKAQAERRASIAAARKTLPPLVTALLAKSGVEPEERLDPATLDKTLASLSVEQRIAVKGQMARAGLID
jgi:ABC-type transporter Mla subunit MlaD